MRFYADLHIHSKYSRACSRDCDLENLAWWSRRKGVTLVGTGDFTHPAWNQHLRDTLVPAEQGLYKLADDLDKAIMERLPATCRGPVRFMLSVEISTIYKRGDRTRKVHHLVYLPDLDAVSEFNRRLGRIGNLNADGRPILGLDSRDLLEITLESGDGGYLIPAHVWTPWFAVLGSKSGFDAIEDCYADLADHIFAAETGLSSDPAMNWQVSSLDRYTLVSNSDAHSPPALAREATWFDCDLDYAAVRRALETRDGFGGTIEFFPEEGKYHADGHRNCDVRMDPPETKRLGGRCPTCGKPLTIGVLHRVADLADRPEGARPARSAPFRSLIPLPELVGEVTGVGAKSKGVARLIDGLVARLGPELDILQDTPLDDLAAIAPPLLVEAIDRVRRGDVVRDAGYDGEYGVIRAFDPDELRAKRTASATLFEPAPARPPARGRGTGSDRATGTESDQSADRPPDLSNAQPADLSNGRSAGTGPAGTLGTTGSAEAAHPAGPTGALSPLDGLDPDQRAAAEVVSGPLLIVAGPGTGKTRTLTHRIAHLVGEHGVAPERCLAITFTRRAAAELDERLRALLPEPAGRVEVATFHALGLRILRDQQDAAGLGEGFRIADDDERLALVRELAGGLTTESSGRRLLAELSALKRARAASLADPPGATAELIATLGHVEEAMRERGLVDLDDLLVLPVRLLTADPELAASYTERWPHVSVDEYQDVDELQYRLLRLLVPPDGNLCAIGDPDQAIYSFRGADVGFFLRFAKDFPSARTVQLTRNYRSSRAIVDGALQAIAPTALVRERELAAVRRGPAPLITVHEAASERAEAEFVARTIDRLLGGASFHSLDSGRADGMGDHFAELSFGDIAVLYRTGAQAGPLAEALGRAGLPFQKRTHERLLDHAGVRAIVEILRSGSLPARSAPAAVEAPGSASTPTLIPRDPDRDSGSAHGPVHGGGGLAATASPLLRDAARVAIQAAPASAGDADLPALIEAAVDLLGPLAERCGDDLDSLLAELALGAQVDAWDPRADRISLLTLHAAKGLEFPVVFLVGCEDGLLPLRFGQAQGAHHDDAEERRLFFVGMTRAQSHLYLTHARQRMGHGVTKEASPSPFLDAIAATLLAHERGKARRQEPTADQLSLL